MQFRPHTLVLLALVSLGSPTLTLAASSPPLDVIELLGEMEDDSMLTAALAELEKSQTKIKKQIAPKPVANKTLTWLHL